MPNNGTFVISLDYELMWGVRDKRTVENYGDAIKGVDFAIDEMLRLFSLYEIKSTVAIVGFLFHSNRSNLLSNIPNTIPSYIDKSLSPYINIDKYIGENNLDDPYYFGYPITKKLINHKLVEIATHTHCHYYCLEEGQTLEEFEVDLQTTILLAKKENICIETIIFPRNQYSHEYLRICKRNGITTFRGTEKNRIYMSNNNDGQTPIIRIKRLLDAYINITGHNCYHYSELTNEILINIPSSRFFRAYDSKLSFLEPLKLKRIKDGMTYAAKNNEVYHLWWHPHNFGRNTKQNIKNLNTILKHYKFLNDRYGFESHTMNEISSTLNDKL